MKLNENDRLMKPGKRIAQFLVVVYREKKVPHDLSEFQKAGFTKKVLEEDVGKLFQMLILAAYDRQPFTWWAGGYEPIWGIAGDCSLPSVLTKQGIFRPENVRSIRANEVRRKLCGSSFFGHSLNSYGRTDFGRTFVELAEEVSILHKLIVTAKTRSDVVRIRRDIDANHGFGPPIVAKVIQYTMREIGLGSVPSKEFAPVVYPILSEYHNSKIAKELENHYGAGVVARVFTLLEELEEPFAVDALFLVDREEPELRKVLFSEY